MFLFHSVEHDCRVKAFVCRYMNDVVTNVYGAKKVTRRYPEWDDNKEFYTCDRHGLPMNMAQGFPAVDAIHEGSMLFLDAVIASRNVLVPLFEDSMLDAVIIASGDSHVTLQVKTYNLIATVTMCQPVITDDQTGFKWDTKVRHRQSQPRQYPNLIENIGHEGQALNEMMERFKWDYVNDYEAWVEFELDRLASEDVAAVVAADPDPDYDFLAEA